MLSAKVYESISKRSRQNQQILLRNLLFSAILSPVMEKIKLEKRELVGKKIKKLREENLVPAVIYNSKGESENVSVDKGTAVQLYKTATPTTILDVELGKKSKKAIVKDFDINPRTDQLLHVSFFEIDPKVKMDFTLPFTLKGISPAVKNNIGILVQISDSVSVRCKVEDLIPEIEIDVTELEHPGQTITMEDLELPEGVELVHKEDEDLPIATITQLQKIEVIETEEPEEEEGEEGEEGEEVEGEEGEEGEAGKEVPEGEEGQEEPQE
jgi:large subunit ribosomal protein L25